jgi:hypothetical protein
VAVTSDRTTAERSRNCSESSSTIARSWPAVSAWVELSRSVIGI